ncbi:MAG: PriCT-2 domain-containing protein [Janthinobacterium lividum]
MEILGDGQQFVAYHIHPDTQQPYEWLSLDDPTTMETWELNDITAEQAQQICDYATSRFQALGWTTKSSVKRHNESTNVAVIGTPAADDWTQDITGKTEHTLPEIRSILFSIPNDGEGVDYDTWMELGMAVWHQTNGSNEGFELFDEWSRQSNKHAQKETNHRFKWDSWNAAGKGAAITFRVVLDRAKPFTAKRVAEAVSSFEDRLKVINDAEELDALCVEISRVERNLVMQHKLEHAVRAAHERVNGVKLGMHTIRSMIKYRLVAGEEDGDPTWMRGWIYVTGSGEFINQEDGRVMSKDVFNTAHANFLLTKKQREDGLTHPGINASDFALNKRVMRQVAGRIYKPMPGIAEPNDDELDDTAADTRFRFPLYNGVPHVNTYRADLIPSIPDTMSDIGKIDCEIVRRHLKHLIADGYERRMLMDWLCYIVQTGKRPAWAVLLQGCEGDGKTFFVHLMKTVLGADNAESIPGEALMETNTKFAEGNQFVLVEEIRLIGHNRYDVYNKMKPFITNETVNIRRMNTDWYPTPNSTSYFLTTNFQDAIPVNDGDRRYFVLFSRWQIKNDLDAFEEQNPNYYTELFAALARSPGSIRRMMLTWKIHEDFKPHGRAPTTLAKAQMAALTKPDRTADLEDLLDDSTNPALCVELVSALELTLAFRERDIVVPATTALNRLLSSSGFQYLGRLRINGALQRYFSRKPGQFMKNGVVDPELIRDFLDPL